jgi:hypothetical protein
VDIKYNIHKTKLKTTSPRFLGSSGYTKKLPEIDIIYCQRKWHSTH